LDKRKGDKSMKAKDLLEKRNYPSILIYGIAGSRKTTLVSQAKNAYMFDFDDGMLVAAKLKDSFSYLRQNIEFDTYTEEKPSAPKMWIAAENKILQLSNDSAAGKLKHSCVIIDSLSGMAQSITLHVMSTTGDSFKKPQIQQWGTMVNIMEKALTILRSLKCLLIVTAHETNLEVDGMNLIRPLSITQKHSINKLQWLFDEVWHTRIAPAGAGKQKFLIRGTGTSSISARTRMGLVDEVDFTNLSLEDLLKKIGYVQNT